MNTLLEICWLFEIKGAPFVRKTPHGVLVYHNLRREKHPKVYFTQNIGVRVEIPTMVFLQTGREKHFSQQR